MKVIVTLLLLLLTFASEAAKILVMLPLPLYSHTNAYMPLVKELAKRGHNITVVSPFPQDKPIDNIVDIEIPKLYMEITDPSMFVLKERSVFEDMKIFWDFGLRGSEAALKEDAVQKLISSPVDSFDLILTETFFLLEPMAALSFKFRCPMVNLHPWSMTLPIAYFTGNSLPSSYIPSTYTTYSDDMTFVQRTRNFLINTIEFIGLHFYYLPRQDKIMRNYMEDLQGFENLPYITELLKNTSLTLLDAHYALDYQRPYFRNVIEIGGLTVFNKQYISNDLQKYLDESTQGFIYFSLGSHLPSSMLPDYLKENLFKVFGKIKENVIMKWDDTDVARPNNVRIYKWVPQLEILKHPNCKLFVTHGGLHAIQEAVYFKVPLVGLPLVADQPINMKFVEHIGLGIRLDVFNTTEKLLFDAITNVISNKRFKEVAVERSSMIRDNADKILDNAIYHIEYLFKHKNLSHLRPPSLQKMWYEILLLDVQLFLIITGVLIFLTAISLLRIIYLIFGAKRKHKKTLKIQ